MYEPYSYPSPILPDDLKREARLPASSSPKELAAALKELTQAVNPEHDIPWIFLPKILETIIPPRRHERWSGRIDGRAYVHGAKLFFEMNGNRPGPERSVRLSFAINKGVAGKLTFVEPGS